MGGRALPTPGPVPTLLLACYQATIADLPRGSAPRATSCRWWRGPGAPERRTDVIAAAAAVAGPARGGRGGAPTPPDRLGLTGRAGSGPRPLAEWARGYRPPTRERVLLAAHRGPGYVYWRQLAGVVVLSGRPAAGGLPPSPGVAPDELPDRAALEAGRSPAPRLAHPDRAGATPRRGASAAESRRAAIAAAPSRSRGVDQGATVMMMK